MRFDPPERDRLAREFHDAIDETIMTGYGHRS